MSAFKVNKDMFGKYAIIPTNLNGDRHIYKIITLFESNVWCEVPIKYNSEPVRHKEIKPVVNVIHCGIDETKVIRIALEDCEIVQPKTYFEFCCEDIENMAQAIDIMKVGWTKEQIVEWLKQEV